MTCCGPALSSGFVKPPVRCTEHGFALLLVLLTISLVGVMLGSYQLGKSRDARYQIYFALGQDFANLARTSHAYAQDIAYYDPYIRNGSTEETQFVGYFESIKTSRVAAMRDSLIDIHNAVGTQNGLGRFTLTDMQKTFPGSFSGYVDPDFNFNHAVRGVRYELRAHGGLLPLRTVKELQGASALVVLYARATGAGRDLRTNADMAAFRAGAISNGLARIGVVLPATQRTGLLCNGVPAVVMWGNTDADCLTAGDASALGMNLQPFDVVAPAWEAAQKQLVKNIVYRRPQPGLQDTNIMYVDLKMDGTLFGGAGGTPNSILDASEFFTDSVNVDNTPASSELQVGNTTPGAPLADAQLLVGRANNPYYTYSSICPRADAGACLDGPIDVKEDMAINYRPHNNPDIPTKTPPAILLKVDQGVDVKLGNVTVTADNGIYNGEEKGFFDVRGTGSSHSVFKINGSGAGSGMIINQTVKVNKYTIKDPTDSNNFVISDEVAINGGKVTVGTDADPSQVVFSSAPVENVSIDTTGKGSGAGVYGSHVETDDLEQNGSTPLIFKKVDFVPAATGGSKLIVKNNVNVDRGGRHPNNDCVGVACPDYVTQLPTGVPLR